MWFTKASGIDTRCFLNHGSATAANGPQSRLHVSHCQPTHAQVNSISNTTKSMLGTLWSSAQSCQVHSQQPNTTPTGPQTALDDYMSSKGSHNDEYSMHLHHSPTRFVLRTLCFVQAWHVPPTYCPSTQSSDFAGCTQRSSFTFSSRTSSGCRLTGGSMASSATTWRLVAVGWVVGWLGLAAGIEWGDGVMRGGFDKSDWQQAAANGTMARPRQTS